MKSFSNKLIPVFLASILVLGGLPSCRKELALHQKRYVVLSPEVAEIITELGAAHDIVGISQECDYPGKLAWVPKVGNFGGVDREAVLRLAPTIIFTSALEQDAISTEFTKLGYRVESVYPKSLPEMLAQIKRLGSIVGREPEAEQLAGRINAVLDSIAAVSEGKPRPRVYIEINRDPLMSVSDQSFVGQLIEVAGGDNVFGTLARDYCRISSEDVVRAAPDIIICYSQDTLQNIKARKGWQDIPAIRSGRIYLDQDLDPDLIQRAGPRIILGLRQLRALYDAWERNR